MERNPRMFAETDAHLILITGIVRPKSKYNHLYLCCIVQYRYLLMIKNLSNQP